MGDAFKFTICGRRQLEAFIDYLECNNYIHYEISRPAAGKVVVKIYGISESDGYEIHSELTKIREKYPH